MSDDDRDLADQFKAACEAELEQLRAINERVGEWIAAGREIQQDITRICGDVGKRAAEVHRRIVETDTIDPADWWRRGESPHDEG
ncbi:MAG: hypothetical protein U0805_11390 [Pirellulales bacterium]